jgi:hypothetical protein
MPAQLYQLTKATLTYDIANECHQGRCPAGIFFKCIAIFISYLLHMPTEIIHTVHLFPELDHHLNRILKSLDTEDWNKFTLAKKWTVKDVAAHLLDGNIRAVSIYRDNFFGEPPPGIRSYQDLVSFLNELNHSWVKAAKRMSPELLTDLLESTGKEYSRQMEKQELFADAIFPVSWAGEEVSKNWFHIAREYTEKYHHQMQIRDAVGATAELITPELFRPFIHTLLMGLPHTYKHVDARDHSIVKIAISGNAGGEWFLLRTEDKWELTGTLPAGNIIATIILSPDTAWKLFTKGITAEQAKKEAQITGAVEIGSTALSMIAVMA